MNTETKGSHLNASVGTMNCVCVMRQYADNITRYILSLTLYINSATRLLYSEDVGFLRLSENIVSEPSINLISINLSGNTRREIEKNMLDLM